MFSPNQLDQFVPTGSGDVQTDADVARFCRKHKVESAMVVANILTEDTARKINSIEGLLTEAAQI